jgi:hypothetical protein
MTTTESTITVDATVLHWEILVAAQKSVLDVMAEGMPEGSLKDSLLEHVQAHLETVQAELKKIPSVEFLSKAGFDPRIGTFRLTLPRATFNVMLGALKGIADGVMSDGAMKEQMMDSETPQMWAEMLNARDVFVAAKAQG